MEHASSSSSMSEIAHNNSRQHLAGAAPPRVKETPPVCPTDQEAVAPKARTRTFDYIWRSGTAGGIAGCAVSSAEMKMALVSY